MISVSCGGAAARLPLPSGRNRAETAAKGRDPAALCLAGGLSSRDPAANK